jgi:phenylpropionate dioxygenase-like ring-hydroxylating dioxygenase large terminal subunit
MSRLPLPFGWFQVAWASDLGAGSVRPLEYFGRHLVLWRDAEEVAHLNDAFCPHLGAHLGHGGQVDGTSIACPFHGWQFDPDGRNTRIPYSARLNRSCSLGSYPLIERNGLLMAWFHPDGDEPKWEIPEIPELSHPTGYSDPQTREFHVAAAWQEMAENGADSAHFGFVHGQDIVPTIEAFEMDGPILTMRSTQRWPTPDGVVDAFVEVTNYGPGFSVVRMTGIIDTVSVGCNTPVSEDRCHLRFTFAVKPLGDPALTAAVGDGFISLLSDQIGEDARIWEHKTYLERPALSDRDGPIMQFRSWAQQFYPRSN